MYQGEDSQVYTYTWAVLTEVRLNLIYIKELDIIYLLYEILNGWILSLFIRW